MELEQEDDIDEVALLEERGNSKRGSTQKPPAAVSQQNRSLYGGANAAAPAAPKQVASTALEVQVAMRDNSQEVIASLGLDRMVRLLKDRPAALKIIVNKVGIHLPVIGWDLQPRNLLCFVTGDVRCDLPLTDDVQVILPDKTIRATFVGQWHSIPWLPFQIVAFGIPEEEES